MSFLLTVAIPTYKRPALLKKCLESIFSQASPDWLRVVVFDDSLSNINESVGRWAESQYSNFDLILNNENLGIDRNIEKCLNVDEGDYILVLGEDDVLMPGGAECIKAILQERHVDILFTNYVYLNNSLTEVIRAPFRESGSIEPRLFVEKYLWAIGFVGGCVFSSDFMRKSKRRFLGTYFNHVGRIGHVMDWNTKIEAAPAPLIGNRADDISTATWSKSFYDVLFGFEGLMDTLAKVSPLNGAFLVAKESFRKAMGHHSIVRVAVMRSYGIYDRSTFDLHFSPIVSGLKRQMLKQISCAPTWLFVPLRKSVDILRLIKRMTYQVPERVALK
ncbi:glycosyltransferase family 2 protein [Pandoraea apista]|uniref:glycosyltransferase family 2 protein n=1 Tax=Pandoraea apista TaxID=93218 RepID=UPI00248F06E8|nr:glycosyltransferase [Pandoraea apista]